MAKDNLILQTKLIPPQEKGKILRRERLLKLLKENLDKKLILICADAGYGKTTLLAQFCEEFDRPFLFYDLDATDNDIATFFNYLATGIQQHYADFGLRTKSIIPQTRNIEILVGTFINEFVEHSSHKGRLAQNSSPLMGEEKGGGEIDRDFYIILDDYHHLQQNKEITNALDYLLHHLPVNLHLIISSRSIPSLNLAYYLAKQELFKLEKEQLQFNLKEIQALLKEVYGLKVPDEEIERIEKHSEGWITAIQLILQKICASGVEKTKETLNGYVASGKEVFDYFAHEIYESEPEEIQEFLMKTSILEHFDSKTCREVFNINKAPRILNYLLEENLFITSINKEFKYHPLFREFLNERVKEAFGEEKVKKLNKKIGKYLITNKKPLKAIMYFLIAERYKKVIKIIEKHAQELISAGQINQLSEWIDQIPQYIMHTHPRLLVYEAEVNISLGKWEQAFDILNKAERHFKISNNDKGEAEVLYNKGIILLRLGKLKESLKISRKAIKLLNSKNVLLRAKILHTLGWIKSNVGEYEKAVNYLQEGLSLCKKIKDKSLQAQFINALAVLEYRTFNYNQAIEYYDHLINQYGKEIISPSNLSNIYGNAASIYIEQKEYKSAEELIAKAENLAKRYNDQRSLLYLTGVRGKFYFQQGEFDKAIGYFEKVLSLNKQFSEKRINIFADFDLSTIFRGKGDYIKSEEYLNKAGAIIEDKKGTIYLHYIFLKAELKSALKDFVSAEKLFKQIVKLAQEIKGYKYIFRAYFFLAQRNAEQRKKKKALEYLSQAISLSRKHNADKFFIQVFQDNIDLFRLALHKGIEKRYLIAILCKIRNPEARALLEEIGYKFLIKKKIFDLEIEFFGGLKIKKSTGETIEPSWLTKKTKSLFGYLIMNRKLRSQREILIENFWREAGIKKGRHNLQMSVSFIRTMLHEILSNKFNKKEILMYKNSKYFLNQNIIFRIDAEKFDELISYATTVEKRDKNKSLEFYKKALEIYKGDYCVDIYDRWCEEKRIYYRELCFKVLKKIAEFQLNNNNYEESLYFNRRALNFNEFDEKIHCSIMQNLAASGDLKAVAEQYKNLQKMLKDELGTSPSAETTRIYQSLISQNS